LKRPRALALFTNENTNIDNEENNTKIRRNNTNGKKVRESIGNNGFTEFAHVTKKELDATAEIKNLKMELALKEAELERGRNEIKRAMNKYDSRMILYEERVKKELDCRRAWKAREDNLIFEKDRLSREIEQLKSSAADDEARDKLTNSLLDELRPSASALTKLLKLLKNDTNPTSTNASRYVVSESDLMKVPFCVVCQAHTADVLIVGCGHVCLCFNHAQQMLHNSQLKQCPVCLQKCTSICQLQGVSKVDVQEFSQE
jgi:hypothetical protein